MVHVYDQCIVNWFGDEELSDEESASNNDVSKLVSPRQGSPETLTYHLL